MQRTPFIFIAALVYLTSCTSCSEKKNTDESIFLHGKWTVENATRGGQSTTLLNGTWFEFFPSGEMDTNLQTLEGKTAFSLDKGILRKEGRIPVDFTVKTMTDTALVLGFEMRSQQFELNLIRSNTASENNMEEEDVQHATEPLETETMQ